jgi:UDP-GlcNAc:undecaprenyl-phosphate/decaprenyl-phosphate GlcNAc-1-phosphate transferase
MLVAVLLSFAAAFAAAVVLTPLVRSVARRYGLVVAPREDRWHDRPTALYGGVAIALGCGVGIVTVGVMFGLHITEHIPALAIIGAAGLLFGVGIVDDARGIGPVGKLILQLAAATFLIGAGVVYPLTPFTPVNVLVTLFWFVGIANALNLLDNMDGVTAGVSAVAGTGFAVLFAIAGDPVLAAVSLAVAGGAAGFLVFNFNPASIFMGDSGSLFLGAALAGLGAAYPLVNGTGGPVAVLIPALVLLVPIVDTTLVSVTRTLHNRRISVGGRDHSTHRLVAMGFSERGAAVFLHAGGFAAFVVSWTLSTAPSAVGLWGGMLFLAGALLFAGYLSRLHEYDDSRPQERRRRGLIVRNLLLKRRGLELTLDVVLFGVAYYGAFLIYYDGAIPSWMGAVANATLGVVIVLKLAAFHYFRVYRGVWDRVGLADVHRIAKATVFGGLLVIGAMFLFARGAEVPRTVFVLDFLLTAALAIAARSSFRSLERFRERLRRRLGTPALIYGAGPSADLVLNILARRAGHSIMAVGFIDGGEEEGTLIHGLPVLGPVRKMKDILQSVPAKFLILASPMPAGRVGAELREICDRADVEILAMSISLSPAGDFPRRSYSGSSLADALPLRASEAHPASDIVLR